MKPQKNGFLLAHRRSERALTAGRTTYLIPQLSFLKDKHHIVKLLKVSAIDEARGQHHNRVN